MQPCPEYLREKDSDSRLLTGVLQPVLLTLLISLSWCAVNAAASCGQLTSTFSFDSTTPGGVVSSRRVFVPQRIQLSELFEPGPVPCLLSVISVLSISSCSGAVNPALSKAASAYRAAPRPSSSYPPCLAALTLRSRSTRRGISGRRPLSCCEGLQCTILRVHRCLMKRSSVDKSSLHPCLRWRGKHSSRPFATPFLNEFAGARHHAPGGVHIIHRFRINRSPPSKFLRCRDRAVADSRSCVA